MNRPARRPIRATLYFLSATVLVLAGAAVALLGVNLLTYSRLTHEEQAAQVAIRRLGDEDFLLTLNTREGAARTFDVRGDDWQIDARVLKWRPWASVLGLDPMYRLERLSGRYVDIERERNAPRTVHNLSDSSGIDFWALARRSQRYLPLADALYGSAAYVPMADGAQYVVTVAPSGLVVRPANGAAREALGAWK